MKRCVYCAREIPAESALDVCDYCGPRIWGDKMFETIKQSMQNALENNDLVSTNMNPDF
jgi:rRNA maturation endonuclease Nob1